MFAHMHLKQFRKELFEKLILNIFNKNQEPI